MTSIIADSNLPSALGECGGPVQIVSPDGTLMGHYTPAPRDDKAAYEYVRSIADLDEWERRKASKDPGITTAELLAKLNGLEAK